MNNLTKKNIVFIDYLQKLLKPQAKNLVMDTENELAVIGDFYSAFRLSVARSTAAGDGNR